jgi:hypothetical protein
MRPTSRRAGGALRARDQVRERAGRPDPEVLGQLLPTPSELADRLAHIAFGQVHLDDTTVRALPQRLTVDRSESALQREGIPLLTGEQQREGLKSCSRSCR